MGVVMSFDQFFIFGAQSISWEWLAEARGYIKSCQTNDKSPLKGAWLCSRDPFCMRNCVCSWQWLWL